MSTRSRSGLRLKVTAFLLAILLIGCTAISSSEWTGSSPQITQSELLGHIESDTLPVILDVRTPEEYKQSHVPGAINIPVQDLENRLEELTVPEGDFIAVYCERGVRADSAEDILYAAGFDSIFHLQGDMSEWRKQGLPTE